MRVTLDLNKSLEENASVYFEKAKKARKKLEGAKKALEISRQRVRKKPKAVVKPRRKEWFEKFRWFYSSDGFLCIGGRDATSNEVVVKKHADKDDIIFHTDTAGSPFVIVKTEKKQVPKTTMEEAAVFTGVFSRAWKAGMPTIEVFHVKPKQVTKEAQSGEYLPKGAFMIRGKTEYHRPKLEYAVGFYKDRIMGGPLTAIKKHCEKFILIKQGDQKVSDIAKRIRKKLGGEVDDIIRVLPQGVAT